MLFELSRPMCENAGTCYGYQSCLRFREQQLFLHYNDTCKGNQQFTGGGFKAVKLNIASYYVGDC